MTNSDKYDILNIDLKNINIPLKKKIAVLGSGTAGVQSVCHFLAHLKDYEVICIHNPQKNILGIGESSNIQLPKLLWDSVKYNPYLHGDELDLTYKFGVKFENWRQYNFFSPITPNGFAIHFNNFKLSEVIFKKCSEVHPDRFKELKGNIDNIDQDFRSVKIKVDNKILEYDYVVDCRGYPEDYSNYHISKSLPLNKCFAYTMNVPGDWQYTYHRAHKNGWMFGIPLKTRQGWGYLFNDNITTEEESLTDLSNMFNKNIKKSDIKEFKFNPYRAKKFLEGRIIKNGNRGLFYEPIEALSGVFYDIVNRALWDLIMGVKDINSVNDWLNKISLRYENFICFAYHGGSIYKTKFWERTVENTTSHLKKNDIWDQTIMSIKQDKEEHEFEWWPFPPYIWKHINETGYKYNYF